MTKQLEQLFNLPENQQTLDKADSTPKSKRVDSAELKVKSPAESIRKLHVRNPNESDKINAALPAVTGLGEAADKELDALAERAISAYDDLIDLGMNVEARYSARIFEVASSMLKNAIDVKSVKINKKLKMLELQLKKQRMDAAPKDSKDSVDVPKEDVILTDRNSLLAKLKNIKESDDE